jgi:tetratricopeptide (TPR) repeat protein
LLEPFRSADDAGTDRITRAEALAALATLLTHSGALEEAEPLFGEALSTLEAEQAWPALTEALVGRAVYLFHSSRLQEAVAILRHALALAEEHDLPTVALRARFNLAGVSLASDRLGEAVEEVNDGLVLARERGDRAMERMLHSQLMPPLVALGRWDEAVRVGDALLNGQSDIDAMTAAAFLAAVAAARGDEALLERCRALAADQRGSTHVDQRVCATLTLARDALERGATDDALRLARAVLDEQTTAREYVAEAYALGIEAAIALGDEAAIAGLEAFVAALPPARATPLLRAGRARFAAEQAHRGGDTEAVERHEAEAIALLRSVGARPLLARALLEQGRRHDDPDALAEARSIYADLGAGRWLGRIEAESGVAG